MAHKEYSRALWPNEPPGEPIPDGWAPCFLAKELDSLPLDEMGPLVTMRDPFNPDFEIICANPYHNHIERIGSFRQYLMSRFYSDYIDFLTEKIEDGSVQIGKRSSSVPSPDTVLVSKAEVERIYLYRKSAEEVYADIIMSAKITVSTDRNGIYRSDTLTQWYRVRTYSSLSPDFHSYNHLVCILVYDRFAPAPGAALDEYLVPYAGSALIDGESADILRVYYPEALKTPCRVNGKRLAERMGLRVKLLRLCDSDGIRGQIYFEESKTEVMDEDGKRVVYRIPADTIVVHTGACQDDEGLISEDCLNDTIIHECYHYYQHRLFYLGQRLYNSELRCLSCTVAGQQIGAMLDSGLALCDGPPTEGTYLAANCFDGKTPVDWMEWQANRAAPRIRMPEQTVVMKIDELTAQYRNRSPRLTTPQLFAKIVCDLARFYGVSRESAKRRMIELGYDEAKGVLNYVNGRYTLDYAFAPASLGQNQTFTIDFEAAADLYRRDSRFRSCIDSGLYQYVDDHFCRTESRFVYRRDGELHLTAYAKAHMDECCLIFSLHSIDPAFLYREGRLQKEAVPGRTVAEYEGESCETDFYAAAQQIAGIMGELPGSPCGTLKVHMERRNITLEALVAKSGVSSRTIARLRNDPEFRPTKPNAIAICIGLQLEPMLQRDWLSKLGIVMSSSTSDVYIELLMSSLYKQPLSVFNEKLEKHGYPPLSRGLDQLDS